MILLIQHNLTASVRAWPENFREGDFFVAKLNNFISNSGLTKKHFSGNIKLSTNFSTIGVYLK